jgi:HK97 family phage major capsid protein
MPATDTLLARYTAETEERSTFMEGLVEAAEQDGRDLNANELELLTRARDRIQELNALIEPLADAAAIARTSRGRTAEIAAQFEAARGETSRELIHRTAGAYVLDYWRGRTGNPEAARRIELCHRAASHQTTPDNPGLLPEPILGPVVSFVDANRALANALGVKQLPASGSFSRPTVNAHSRVAAQTAEKQELVSQKMTIAKVQVTATTYGGYVNVSRQDADWTQPSIMDVLINDLAAQYAIETETATCNTLSAAAQAGGTLPVTPTADDVAKALWSAVELIYQGAPGAGGVIAATGPDMLTAIGPLFPPVNPVSGQSAGLSAGGFGSGAVGSISGIPVYMTPDMAAKTILVLTRAAAECYEDRIGALQVVEPSVLGIQLAYAGYFASVVLQPLGIVKITGT